MKIYFKNENVNGMQAYLTTIANGLMKKTIVKLYDEQVVKMFFGCLEELSKEFDQENFTLKEKFIQNFGRVTNDIICMIIGDKKYTKAKETIFSNYLELLFDCLYSLKKNQGLLLYFPMLDTNGRLWQYELNEISGEYSQKEVDTTQFKRYICY